jgi:hypothetical protein
MTVNTKTTAHADWGILTDKKYGLQLVTQHVAKNELRRDQAKGFMQDPITIVDKVVGAHEANVRFGGKIVYVDRFLHIADVVEDIWQSLVEKSPIGNAAQKRFGRAPFRRLWYHKEHKIFFNRKMIEPSQVENALKSAKAGDEIAIANLLPYAKRIEYGRGIHKPADRKRLLKTPNKTATAWSLQAPHGVYRRVFVEAKRRHGNRTFIKYRLVRAPEIGYSFTHFTKDGPVKMEQRYPAILIKVSKLTKTG